mgnify:CR=1 FL=1
MITQYPWVAVKKQERKHIEIGMMITLLLAIISFYSVPEFGQTVNYKEAYVPPPLEVYSIPATVQPPERIMPLRPAIPVESENEDIDLELPAELDMAFKNFGLLAAPEPPAPPITYLEPWMVSDPPVLIAGTMQPITYPEIAREAGIEGTVTLKVFIGIDGLVKDAMVYKGVPKTGLDEVALNAVLTARYQPALQMGKPVPVSMYIPIIFSLKEG